MKVEHGLLVRNLGSIYLFYFKINKEKLRPRISEPTEGVLFHFQVPAMIKRNNKFNQASHVKKARDL